MDRTGIIDHATPPDFAKLRVIAREVARRLRDLVSRAAGQAETETLEARRLASLTLAELCREAMDALFPDRHKV